MNSETSDETTPIRVLIVDDHPAVCQGLALLLKSEGIGVCAEASERAHALRCVEICRPDLAIVDLSLGEDDGLVLVSDLHKRAIPSLVYSMHEDGQHVQGAFAAGALGYVTKREIQQVLVQGIHEVAARRRFVGPRAAFALADRVAGAGQVDPQGVLSYQEQQVYRLLGEGEGTAETATALKISTRTVESYYARILIKLGLNGMRELRRHSINYLRDNRHWRYSPAPAGESPAGARGVPSATKMRFRNPESR